MWDSADQGPAATTERAPVRSFVLVVNRLRDVSSVVRENRMPTGLEVLGDRTVLGVAPAACWRQR